LHGEGSAANQVTTAVAIDKRFHPPRHSSLHNSAITGTTEATWRRNCACSTIDHRTEERNGDVMASLENVRREAAMSRWRTGLFLAVVQAEKNGVAARRAGH
jgi:hypothetical protein